MAGVMEALASPFNCIYSAAKLKQNPRYPETEIMGSGAFTFVEPCARARPGTASVSTATTTRSKPYLDGYKAFFVKSSGRRARHPRQQFDAEFRGRNPQEKATASRQGERQT